MLGVTLPSPKQQTEGECTVTGWGTLSAGGQTPDVLMKVSDFIKKKHRYTDFKTHFC